MTEPWNCDHLRTTTEPTACEKPGCDCGSAVEEICTVCCAILEVRHG